MTEVAAQQDQRCGHRSARNNCRHRRLEQPNQYRVLLPQQRQQQPLQFRSLPNTSSLLDEGSHELEIVSLSRYNTEAFSSLHSSPPLSDNSLYRRRRRPQQAELPYLNLTTATAATAIQDEMNVRYQNEERVNGALVPSHHHKSSHSFSVQLLPNTLCTRAATSRYGGDSTAFKRLSLPPPFDTTLSTMVREDGY